MDNREFAQKDPRAFLELYKPPLILDEIQRVPDLFSYMQEFVDAKKTSGQYIVTGSQNFVLSNKVSQTLAGRINLVHLPTFTNDELTQAEINVENWEEYAFKGSYPRVWDKKLTPQEWYPSYIETYLERDVRDLKNVIDIKDFQIFMKICASYAGRTLVLDSIANEMGVSHNTIKSIINTGKTDYGYFMRDKTGNEIDYVLDNAGQLTLVEIKSAKTLNTDCFKGIAYWKEVIKERAEDNYLIYAGKEEKRIYDTNVLRWDNANQATK